MYEYTSHALFNIVYFGVNQQFKPKVSMNINNIKKKALPRIQLSTNFKMDMIS